MQDVIWAEWVEINQGGVRQGAQGVRKKKSKKRGGEKGGGSKREKAAANAPRKNLTAYMLFCKDERIKKDLTGTVKEQGCELGRRWRVLGEEEKLSFIQKAVDDKARYQEEMVAFSSMQEATVEEEEEGGEESEGKLVGRGALEEQLAEST